MTSEPFIPKDVQQQVKDLAERAEHFADSSRNGASWTQIHTWLLAMKPRVDELLEIGQDGIRRSARMPISTEKQEQILRDFVVPNSIEEQQ